jgi:hypothetical protein
VVHILSVRSSVKSSHGATTVIDIQLSAVNHCLHTVSLSNSEVSIVEINLYDASDPGQLAQGVKVHVSLSVERAIFQEGFFFSRWNHLQGVLLAPSVLRTDD